MESTGDIAAAWEVAEKVWDTKWFRVDKSWPANSNTYVWEAGEVVYAFGDNDIENPVQAETAPLAICLAALQAVGVNVT